MKTSVKIILAALAVGVISLSYGLQYLRMEFADSADYTTKDVRLYDFYTPELLKKMPRVSNNYTFHYSNVDGPNPALIYQVTFSGATVTTDIDSYLEKNGYKKVGICNTNEDCWAGKDPNVTLSVRFEERPVSIRIRMVDKVGY